MERCDGLPYHPGRIPASSQCNFAVDTNFCSAYVLHEKHHTADKTQADRMAGNDLRISKW